MILSIGLFLWNTLLYSGVFSILYSTRSLYLYLLRISNGTRPGVSEPWINANNNKKTIYWQPITVFTAVC